jgi:hypothetical protein
MSLPINFFSQISDFLQSSPNKNQIARVHLSSSEAENLSSHEGEVPRDIFSQSPQATDQLKQDKNSESSTRYYFMADAEQAERIYKILDRLSPEQQASLIDTSTYEEGETTFFNLKSFALMDEDFLSLAEQLDDEQLSQLVNVFDASAIQTQYEYGSGPIMVGPRKDKLNVFMDVLKKSGEEDLSRILSSANQLAESVTPQSAIEKSTYNKNDISAAKFTNESTQNFSSFIQVVNDNDNIMEVLDKVDALSTEQQSQIINIMSFDNDLGTRLLDKLPELNDETSTNLLNYLADKLKDKPLVNLPSYALWMEGEDLKASRSILSDVVTLLDDYEIEETEINKMLKTANSLSMGEQSAYFQITRAGLEQLTEADHNNKVMVEAEDIDKINSLRDNSDIRQLVYHTRKFVDDKVDNSMAIKNADNVVELLLKRSENSDNADKGELITNLSAMYVTQRNEAVTTMLSHLNSNL